MAEYVVIIASVVVLMETPCQWKVPRSKTKYPRIRKEIFARYRQSTVFMLHGRFSRSRVGEVATIDVEKLTHKCR